MAKVILEFDTETQNNELMRCLNATQMFIVVADLLNEMRKDLKYGDVERTTEQWQEYLLVVLDAHNIDMNWLD